MSHKATQVPWPQFSHNYHYSNVENVNPGVATLVKGDVGNRELIEHLIQIYSFDAVFHFRNLKSRNLKPVFQY